MNKSFEYLMYLFACGAKGEQARALPDADFEEIIRLAKAQGAWQTVFLAIKQSENANLIDAELFKEINALFLLSCIKNQQKLEFINKVIAELEASGVEVCVLKGQSLAQLYKEPDCRISGDVDLLVDIKDEQKAIEILRKFEFNVEARPYSSNHSECVHPVFGIVELHIALYYDIIYDVWFDNVEINQEKPVVLNGIKTLGITDNYIFIALHAVKHFLSDGLGIRQIMDLLLFTKRYKNEIDKNRVNETLGHLKYQKFVDNLFGIGIKYFGFKQDDLFECEYNSEQIIKILEGVEIGGLFGKNTVGEKRFFETYNSMRFNTFKSEKLENYMAKWSRKNAIKKSSLSMANMKKYYPFLEQKPHLLIVAYAKHLSMISKAIIKRNKLKRYVSYKVPIADNEKIKERIELIKSLGMV